MGTNVVFNIKDVNCRLPSITPKSAAAAKSSVELRRWKKVFHLSGISTFQEVPNTRMLESPPQNPKKLREP
jgi:hypothetical protein